MNNVFSKNQVSHKIHSEKVLRIQLPLSVLVAMVMALALLIRQSRSQQETSVTDLVDQINFNVINPFTSDLHSTTEMSTTDLTTDKSSTSTPNPPVNLEFVESFDFSSLELTSDSTTYSSTETSATTGQWDDIVKLTSKLHKSRVKVANFSYMIKEQQKIIAKLTRTVRDLENDVTKLKSTKIVEIDELKSKNENCRKDFNSLTNQLKVAKNLYGLQRYSERLKLKLSEFGVVGDQSV